MKRIIIAILFIITIIIAIIKMKLNEFPKRIPMIIPMSIGSKGICAKGYLIKFAHC